MTNSAPKISVLMSAYNAEAYLSRAIDSLLEQTFRDWELIVLNDGSTDNTATILKSFNDARIKIINNPDNIGLTKSLNIGLGQAKGQYIARLDADDISMPERLERQYQFLEKNPQIWLVGSLVKLIDQTDTTFDYQKTPTDPDLIKFLLVFGNPITHSSIVFRRKEILDLGGYDENFRYAQDYNLYSRILDKGQIAVLPEVLVKYRRHEHSVTLHPESRQSAQEFGTKTIFTNISKYIPLNEGRFIPLKKALTTKDKIGFKDTVVSCLLLSKVFNSYKKLERLSPQQTRKIYPYYKNFRKSIIKRFLKKLFL